VHIDVIDHYTETNAGRVFNFDYIWMRYSEVKPIVISRQGKFYEKMCPPETTSAFTCESKIAYSFAQSIIGPFFFCAWHVPICIVVWNISYCIFLHFCCYTSKISKSMSRKWNIGTIVCAKLTGDAGRHRRKRSDSTCLAHDTIVCVGLAGLAHGAGDAQLALQLVAGVAEAGIQQSSTSVGPAVGLARLARDVMRCITQRRHLLIRDAPLLGAEHRLLQGGSARTEVIFWTC
jgi:hypothetical protein